MVSQGDIIAINFSPTQGHEQSGYRPAVVISRDLYNINTGFVVVCPITSTAKLFPARVSLDSRTATVGDILCDQIRTFDLTVRSYKLIEKVPEDIMSKVICIVVSIFDDFSNDL